MIEIYCGHERISSHKRFPSYARNRYDTYPEDIPERFQKTEWNEHNIRQWAASIGKQTLEVIDRIFKSYLTPEKGVNPALSVLKLSNFRIADAMLSNIHNENLGLDKDLLLTLGTCGFVSNNQPVVINGFTGSGKSYLACAIGRQACMQGVRSRYIRVPDLMELLSEATLTTSGRSKLLKKFSGYRLLILDEWLLNDLTELEQHFFFELIERRYDCTSTIFCTQYKREDWHSRLGGGIHADSMMDRIVHTAAWVYSGNINMRELQAKGNMP